MREWLAGLALVGLAFVTTRAAHPLATQPPATPTPAPAAGQPLEPFALGGVGGDGVLTPFAQFDGDAWTRIWAEPAQRLAVPASLRDIPASWYPPAGRVPETWHFWPLVDPRVAASPFDTHAGLPLALRQPVRIGARCVEQVGIATDYQGPTDPPASADGKPMAAAGLATTSPTIRIEQPVALDPDSPLAQWAAERAVVPFHRAEDDHLENYDAAQRKQFPPFTVRRTVPVRWTRVARLGTAQAKDRTYYLEGEVSYTPAAILAGHVWVQVTGAREATDAEVVLTDADRQEQKRRVPLGIVRVGPRRFWVFDSREWEHESREIFEASDVSRAPVSVLEVAAGGC